MGARGRRCITNFKVTIIGNKVRIKKIKNSSVSESRLNEWSRGVRVQLYSEQTHTHSRQCAGSLLAVSVFDVEHIPSWLLRLGCQYTERFPVPPQI